MNRYVRNTETLSKITASRQRYDFSESVAITRKAWGLSPLAIVCSLMLHITFFFSVQYVPSFFPPKPLIDDIMTVNLVSMPEPEAPNPPASTPPPLSQKVKMPEPSPAVVPQVAIEQQPISKPAPVEAKPVSLRPLKRKIRKSSDTRLAEDDHQG